MGRSQPNLVMVSSCQKMSRDQKSWDSVFFSFILGIPAFSHLLSLICPNQRGATVTWVWGNSRQNFPVPPLFTSVKKWVPREAVMDSHSSDLEGQSNFQVGWYVMVIPGEETGALWKQSSSATSDILPEENMPPLWKSFLKFGGEFIVQWLHMKYVKIATKLVVWEVGRVTSLEAWYLDTRIPALHDSSHVFCPFGFQSCGLSLFFLAWFHLCWVTSRQGSFGHIQAL